MEKKIENSQHNFIILSYNAITNVISLSLSFTVKKNHNHDHDRKDLFYESFVHTNLYVPSYNDLCHVSVRVIEIRSNDIHGFVRRRDLLHVILEENRLMNYRSV